MFDVFVWKGILEFPRELVDNIWDRVIFLASILYGALQMVTLEVFLW